MRPRSPCKTRVQYHPHLWVIVRTVRGRRGCTSPSFLYSMVKSPINSFGVPVSTIFEVNTFSAVIPAVPLIVLPCLTRVLSGLLAHPLLNSPKSISKPSVPDWVFVVSMVCGGFGSELNWQVQLAGFLRVCRIAYLRLPRASCWVMAFASFC